MHIPVCYVTQPSSTPPVWCSPYKVCTSLVPSPPGNEAGVCTIHTSEMTILTAFHQLTYLRSSFEIFPSLSVSYTLNTTGEVMLERNTVIQLQQYIDILIYCNTVTIWHPITLQYTWYMYISIHRPLYLKTYPNHSAITTPQILKHWMPGL